MTETTDVALLPPKESALQVYSTPAGLDPYLAHIKAEIDAFQASVDTKKGRDAIASMAFKVARSKTALDNIGKELVAELKDVPKKIDAERKRMRDLLDLWKDQVRQPLTEWEQAEAARIAALESRVQFLRDFTNVDGLKAAGIQVAINNLETVSVGADFGEYEAEAHRVKAASLASLRTALDTRQKAEAEQEELARLRAEAAAREQKEREERIAREAAERAKREAEARAQAEREAAIRREQEAKAAAERRELELKLAAERAEREKAEALRREQQAAADAERRATEAVEAEKRRVAAAAAAEAEEARRRERDKAHKAAVNRAALDAFVKGGLSEECAKQAITLIAKKSIPAVSIAY